MILLDFFLFKRNNKNKKFTNLFKAILKYHIVHRNEKLTI